MSDNDTKTTKGNSDIMIAVIAVLCIALGASMSYWMTHPGKKQQGTVTVNEGATIGQAQPVAATAATPSSAAQPASPPKAEPAAATDSEFMPLTFATLASYMYEIPNPEDPSSKNHGKDQIPQPIKALSGKKVAVQGFMVPVDLKNGKTSNFLLVKDQSLCCFGRMPRMNEWVSVRMKPGKAARVIQDQPVTVFGNIDVGEVMDKGDVLSIYRVESEDVAGPLDL